MTPDNENEINQVGRVLDRCATPQQGVVTSRQLRVTGIRRRQQDSLVRRGMLTSVHPEVYRVAGSPTTVNTRLIAACLAVGGTVAASHRAALWVWDLYPFDPPVEITVVTTRSPLRGEVVVHRSRDLCPEHLTVRHGIPVTTPARTLVDVGCVVSTHVLAQAVEAALLRRVVSVRGLRVMIDEVAGRGRNGVGRLRQLLDERALGDERPESMLEPLLARLCADANINGVEFQRELTIRGRRFRPDFLFRDAKVIVEVDGLAVHGSREALDADLERQNLFIAEGYRVLRYTKTHLRKPDQVARQILTTVASRRFESDIDR